MKRGKKRGTKEEFSKEWKGGTEKRDLYITTNGGLTRGSIGVLVRTQGDAPKEIWQARK